MTDPSMTEANIALVVLLPCAPPTANTFLPLRIKGSASFRESNNIFLLSASINSILSSFTAAE